MNIITDTKALNDLCKALSKQEFVTIDLEFLREKTYYAQLCLIQIAGKKDAAIIDPLAPNLNLTSFFKLLQNKKVVKVFHSCRQDIEILYTLTDKVPDPIFDTQIAAMVCGFGESVSYENLVLKILNRPLDKTSRLSDWSKRPLTQTQLEYALSDVTHLVDIYEFMQEKLKKTGRLKWLDEENEILKDPKTYKVDPYEAWHKIHHRSHSPHFLTILRELAAWRELRAQAKDTVRHSIIKDEVLLNIAAMNPQSVEELVQVRSMRADIAKGKLGSEILEALKKADTLPKSQWVEIEKEQTPSNGSSALLELLRLLLKIKSAEQGVVARLIASDEDLRNLSAFKDKNNKILKGWRYDIFGKDAETMRGGKLCIKYNKDKNKIDIS